MTAKELYDKLKSMGLENVNLKNHLNDLNNDIFDSLGDEENGYGIYYDKEENVVYL